MDEPINNNQETAQTGKSSDPFKMWSMVFAVLFLAAAGVAVWQFIQNGSLSSRVTSVEANAAQLQADKNNLQSQLNALNDDSNNGTDGESSNSADAAKILAAVDAYVRAPVEASKESFEYSVNKNQDSFATVNVGAPEGGGYQLWLKKVGDNWTVLFGGQDMPAQDMVDKYGIPDSFLK
jgi:hypothetical protein